MWPNPAACAAISQRLDSTHPKRLVGDNDP
jgi:hypothetical protein